MPETLTLLPGRYAICRLDADAETPDWANSSGLVSITRTSNELSVVCLTECVPPGVKSETGWVAAVVSGPLPFTATGILDSILHPLAQQEISVFTLSTFDTDYVLIHETDIEKAVHTLETVGHRVTHSPKGSSHPEQGASS